MKLLHIEHVPFQEQADFAQAVRDVSARLGIRPEWLMQIMLWESGLRPDIRNGQQGQTATGLIQFIEDTANALGTTTAQLAQMTRVEQMRYVYAYFKPYAGKMNSVYDVYMVTFAPAFLGKPDSTRMGGAKWAEWARVNRGFDLDRNGQITIGEFKRWIKAKLPNTFSGWVGLKPIPTAGLAVGVLALGLAGFYYIRTHIG
jgi:hypothetical protein